MTEPKTHYPGCWRRHLECARVILESISIDHKEIVEEYEIGKEGDRLPLDAYGHQYPLEHALKAVGEGWAPLVHVLWLACRHWKTDIHQIKEKFGGLRFYVGSADDDLIRLIDTIEGMSYGICENCGRPGRPVELSGWWKTACDKCENAPKEDT